MAIIEKLANGLTVIVEPMDQVESVAYELLVPGGLIVDDEDSIGASLILSELTARGAGQYDSRGLIGAFDLLGARHSEAAGHDRYVYSGCLLSENLEAALKLTSQMVQEPHLPEAEIESIRSGLLQNIRSLADNPARRAMLELSMRYYPKPWSRPGIGTEEGLKNVTIDKIKALWKRCYHPGRAILSVAGKVDPKEVLRISKACFGNWNGDGVERPGFGELSKPSTYHIDHPGAQLQIVLFFPSVKFAEPLYYAAKVGIGVLSGGMFGRLFTEVREKRGLCYSVYARHSSSNDYGTFTAYAGTTPERAHETLSVMMDVIKGVKGTTSQEELDRSRINLKTGIIMGEESVGSRAASNASDWWLLKRIRSLDEISQAISDVTISNIDSFWEKYPPQGISLLTLGSKKLEMPS